MINVPSLNKEVTEFNTKLLQAVKDINLRSSLNQLKKGYGSIPMQAMKNF
jgi:hypothetical protein